MGGEQDDPLLGKGGVETAYFFHLSLVDRTKSGGMGADTGPAFQLHKAEVPAVRTRQPLL